MLGPKQYETISLLKMIIKKNNVGVGWLGGWVGGWLGGLRVIIVPLRGLSCKQRLARFSAELKVFKIDRVWQ